MQPPFCTVHNFEIPQCCVSVMEDSLTTREAAGDGARQAQPKASESQGQVQLSLSCGTGPEVWANDGLRRHLNEDCSEGYAFVHQISVRSQWSSVHQVYQPWHH
jgi:hypothetical protein